MQLVWIFYRKKMEALKVFISHSNKDEDNELVHKEVIPKLEAKNIRIYGQEHFVPGNQVIPTITKMVDITDKTLLFMSKNAMESSWCSFELLISLERAQRTNRLSVVLLLHGISASEIPHIAVLQEARKINFVEGKDEWVQSAAEGLREAKSISEDVMPAGNVAHGLVWSHYAGYLQYVLPVLKKTLMESSWYKGQPADVQSKVSWKLYELVPNSCTCKYDLSVEDENIKEVTTIGIYAVMRGGNHRELSIKLYSVTNGEQTYYCMCEYPNVIGTMKVMEENHLATFCHKYPATNDNQLGVTSAPFTTDDKKLQLGRFYYTMNSVLNHFDNCRDTARVLLFNDEKQKISEVLMNAVREDLPQAKKLKQEILSLQLDNLGPTDAYDYEVYIAHTEHDKEKALEISKYLKRKGIDSILEDEASGNSVGRTRGQQLLFAVHKCHWFVILLTRKALEDDWITFSTLSALSDSIYKRKVRVIPVVDRKEDLYIPEALRWVTYIPFDDSTNCNHLKSLYSIVSGKDIPMETQFLLPAGDVAYGLAWGYVTNYLRKVLPDVLDKGILPVLRKENVGAFRCPHKLYIVIPKSCEAGNVLQDMKHNQGRLINFAKTAAVYPLGTERPFHCTIYKLSTDDSLKEQGLYFVGQYAAPVTCLNEMRGWNIAGVTADTMATETYRFYQIVSQLMEQAVPEKAKYCEFVFFDDINTSLADIMEEKIRSVEVQYT